MDLFRYASYKDIALIRELAHQIWPLTYQDILSPEQIRFMLNDIYSKESLLAQFENGTQFVMAEMEDQPIGFASFSLSDEENKVYKVHKLYLLATFQGKGLGKQIINFIEHDVRLIGGQYLELNVNRNNPSAGFYKKIGFNVHSEIDIPYHQFVINDYVMRKKL